MTPRRRAAALPALCATVLMSLWGAGLVACNFNEPVAGGSSEVDNPVVVLLDEAGTRANVSGSLGIYLSTQSPALHPSPVLEIQLNGVDSVILSPKTFSLALAAAGYADSMRSLNLHLQAGDSAGAFLQGLTYDPVTASFTDSALPPGALLKLTVAPLVQAEATLLEPRDTTGVLRLIIPGSPFQTVLVDSTFTFRNIPPGVFPLHMLQPDGRELPLPAPLRTGAPQPHRVNRDTTPVFRPTPQMPVLRVNAGYDRTVSIGSHAFLSADVAGVNPSDKRLIVLWRQLPSETHEGANAAIQNPTALNTKVAFPRTGAYTFTVTAILGNQQVTDTVIIGVQAARSAPVFIEPGVGDTVRAHQGFSIWWWEDPAYDWWNPPAPLMLEFSSDSGITWGPPPWNAYPALDKDIPSRPGFNPIYVAPVQAAPGTPSLPYCMLRFKRNDEVVAVSGLFMLVTAPGP